MSNAPLAVVLGHRFDSLAGMARAALPDASFLGDVNKIRKLLDEGADVDEADEFGCVIKLDLIVV